MVHLQCILSSVAGMSQSYFSKECGRRGLVVAHNHRLSPHSIKDLLEPWLTSCVHVVLNCEPTLEFQQSLAPLHMFQL